MPTTAAVEAWKDIDAATAAAHAALGDLAAAVEVIQGRGKDVLARTQEASGRYNVANHTLSSVLDGSQNPAAMDALEALGDMAPDVRAPAVAAETVQETATSLGALLAQLTTELATIRNAQEGQTTRSAKVQVLRDYVRSRITDYRKDIS